MWAAYPATKSAVSAAPGLKVRKAETHATAQTICFVMPWPFELAGGVNHVVNNLIRSFRDDSVLGLAPIALELCWDPPVTPEASYLAVKRSVFWLRFPYEPDHPVRSVLSFVLHAPRSLLALRRYVRANNVAVFNVHYPDLRALNLIALRDLKLFRGRIVLSLHGSDIRSAHQGSRIYQWFWRRLLRRASVVVACSDGLREETLMLEPHANAVTIHNGIDLELFGRDSDAEFALPPELQGKRIIVNIGAFEYRKGHDILVQAFQQIALTHADAALLLIGKSGPLSSDIKRLIGEAELGSSVFILEDVPHSRVFDLLKNATIFVLATRWRKRLMGEGFALAILEAAAARLPVVATASCGVEEIIRDGQTGRVVPLEDVAALASAIRDLLDQPDLARRMAGHLHALVREHFTWNEAAKKYAALSHAEASSTSSPGPD